MSACNFLVAAFQHISPVDLAVVVAAVVAAVCTAPVVAWAVVVAAVDEQEQA